MSMDYGINVKGAIERHVYLNPEKPEDQQMLKSEETIKLQFCFLNIVRRYVITPDAAQDPLPLPEIRSPVLPRLMEIPAICFLLDEESVERREIEALRRMGIPEEQRSIIMQKIGSEARKMIADTKSVGGFKKIVVGILAVKREMWDYGEYQQELIRRKYEEEARRAEMESMEEVIEAKPQVSRKACSHFHHQDCIIQWLQTRHIHMCPCCCF